MHRSGHIPLDREMMLETWKGEHVPVEELLQEDGAVLSWIDHRKEPGRHVLNELPDILMALNGWQGKFIIIFPGAEETASFDPGGYSDEKGRLYFMKDNGGRLLKKVVQQAGSTERSPLPVTVVVDPEGEMIDYMEGYRIGLAGRLSHSVQMIKE